MLRLGVATRRTASKEMGPEVTEEEYQLSFPEVLYVSLSCYLNLREDCGRLRSERKALEPS